MRLARVAVAVAALSLAVVSAAHAQEAKWGIRTRALAILPNADATKGIDAEVKADLTFEVDITRYFSPLLSAELILATAGHEVELNGASAGSANILPPTLLLQVHPVRTGSFRPYLGAGVNVTYFYAKSGGLDDLDLGTSFGPAGQVGADILIGSRGSFNLDAKYALIKTKVENNGTEVTTLTINPLVIGVGFGYKF